jgi:hypothetical protein
LPGPDQLDGAGRISFFFDIAVHPVKFFRHLPTPGEISPLMYYSVKPGRTVLLIL